MKQSTLKFWDQICPRKLFWGQNLRKESSNSESTPLNIPMYRASFNTKHFEVLGPNLTKKSFETGFKWKIVEFRSSTLEYPQGTEFHLRQSILKFLDQIWPKKYFGMERKWTIVEFRIIALEPLNTSAYRVSFEKKYFEVWPVWPKRNQFDLKNHFEN